MRVLCLGQSAYDITLPVESYPIENKKWRSTGRIECGGGSASNCAYLLAKWGLDTYFAGVLGNDYYGNKIKKEYEEVNINMKYLETKNDIETVSGYILTNLSNGSRTIVTYRNNDIKMSPIELEEEFDVILFDGYEKDIALDIIKKNPNAITILDAGGMNKDRVELCYLVDYVVCSKDFAEDFSKMKVDYQNEETIHRIYDCLKEEFKTNIVITLEDKGSFGYIDGYKWIPSIKTTVVDSTGAGDIYHGAFVYGVAKGFDLETTMKVANIAGALSVETMGGRYSIRTLDEVMNKYEEHFH